MEFKALKYLALMGVTTNGFGGNFPGALGAWNHGIPDYGRYSAVPNNEADFADHSVNGSIHGTNGSGTFVSDGSLNNSTYGGMYTSPSIYQNRVSDQPLEKYENAQSQLGFSGIAPTRFSKKRSKDAYAFEDDGFGVEIPSAKFEYTPVDQPAVEVEKPANAKNSSLYETFRTFPLPSFRVLFFSWLALGVVMAMSKFIMAAMGIAAGAAVILIILKLFQMAAGQSWSSVKERVSEIQDKGLYREVLSSIDDMEHNARRGVRRAISHQIGSILTGGNKEKD